MNRPTITATAALMFNLYFTASPSLADTSGVTLTPIKSEAFNVLRHFYQYDSNIPLDARIVDQDDEQDYVREKVVFRGIRNSRVPGYLAIPKKGTAPYPCVLLVHGLGGSKEV